MISHRLLYLILRNLLQHYSILDLLRPVVPATNLPVYKTSSAVTAAFEQPTNAECLSIQLCHDALQLGIQGLTPKILRHLTWRLRGIDSSVQLLCSNHFFLGEL